MTDHADHAEHTCSCDHADHSCPDCGEADPYRCECDTPTREQDNAVEQLSLQHGGVRITVVRDGDDVLATPEGSTTVRIAPDGTTS